MEGYEIRVINPDEIPLIRDFPPESWHLDIEALYRFHYGEPYFYPLVSIDGNEITGTGIAIINEDVAWLGTIIVKETHRSRGIGTLITKELINYAVSRKCRKILLTASDMGFPIYLKLGFKISGNYCFYRDGKITGIPDLNKIRKLEESDYEAVAAIDLLATGEDRKKMLYRFMKNGLIYSLKGRIEGFYLPEFGAGLVIASNENAGLVLLRCKMLNDTSIVAVPDSNQAAIRFLEREQYGEFMKLPRMYLNFEASWRPEMIFSRGSGHTG
jgi:GNAT superfamily N-acetyltransferase